MRVTKKESIKRRKKISCHQIISSLIDKPWCSYRISAMNFQIAKNDENQVFYDGIRISGLFNICLDLLIPRLSIALLLRKDRSKWPICLRMILDEKRKIKENLKFYFRLTLRNSKLYKRKWRWNVPS